MKLAVNYSVEAVQLAGEGRIEFDLFKCADWPDMIAEARRHKPVYVHFPYDVGTASGRAVDVETARRMCEETSTPFVNFHLVSYDRDFPEVSRDDDSMGAAVLEKAVADVSAAVEAFGRERVMVENIPWFGAAGEFHRPSVDAELFQRLIKQTQVSFLLDLSHARIAAHYMGVEPKRYIESLPVHRLAELHLTGIKPRNNRLADHMELSEEDFGFARWALERIVKGDWRRPWAVAFEYGGIGPPFKWRSEAAVLERDVPRLRELVANSS